MAGTMLHPLYGQPANVGDLIEEQRWFQALDVPENLPFLIETSPPIANLLMRAEEGIERRDWKLAIDSLQRVIDDRSGTLVPRDGGAHEEGMLFESARRRAMRRLASLPAEGLLAYRVLHDGKAKGLFDRAKAASDAALMQTVADRFLLTRHGDDAADWVASRALDEGRFGEAVARLEDLLAFMPDHDIPAERIYSKLYAAYMAMGFPEKARAAAHALEQGEHRGAMIAAQLGDAWAHQTQDRVVEREISKDSLPRRIGPKLSPSLTSQVPWGFELSGTSADLWRRIADYDAGDPIPIPRLELTGSGQRVFVRIPAGCAALDMEDLDLLWRTISAPLPRASQVEDPRRQMQIPTQAVNRAPGPYHDDPTNRISSTERFVFTIERQGMGEFLEKDEVQAGGVLFLRPGIRAARALSGSRLTAYDSQTGEIRWRRGRTDDPSDVLGNVRFLSPPLVVEGWLWTPYMRGTDLYVASLRPDDGAVMQHVLLGTIREPNQSRDASPLIEPVTPPAMAEGVVYIPTGVGALAAIDVAGMKLRWAYVYDTQAGARPRGDIPSYWIPSAPIVEGGVVVLTAADHEEVLGLSASTGVHLWTTAVEGCSYPIAAFRGQVWLGGRRLVSLNVSDGREIWNLDLPGTPTGRAALCGDRLLVPLSSGLLTVDAITGLTHEVQNMPALQAPMGNISCVGASVFSIEPSSVRKFPDLDRMETMALRELESAPDKIAARIRLAWAQLLRGRPRAAFDAVAGVTADQANSRDRVGLARVKIESLLALTQQTDSPNESLRLLESTNPDDLTPQLRLRYKEAMAQQWAGLGNHEHAYRLQMDSAVSSDADELVPTAESVRVSARLALKEKIAQTRQKLDRATTSKLQTEALSRIRALATTGDHDPNQRELFAWTEVAEGTSVAAEALWSLGQIQMRAAEFEQAEQTLRRCLRTADDSVTTAQAWNRLAQMYLDSSQLSPGLIGHMLAVLEDLVEAPVDHDKHAGVGASPETDLAETAAKLRSTMADERQNLGISSVYAQPGTERVGMSLTGRTAWTYDARTEAEPVRTILFDRGLPPALADRIVVMGRDAVLECISLERKELLWKAKLQLPGTFEEPGDAASRGQSLPRYGVADGQTLIVNGPDGLFAIGLLTGRLLWAKRFDRAVLDLAGTSARDKAMAAGEGELVAAPKDGYLTMMRVADGSVIWERDLRGESVGRVWLEQKVVVFADPAMKRIHLLHRQNGSLIAQILLRQPDPEYDRVTLVVSNGMLFGPDRTGAGDGVVAFELSTGRPAWRFETDKPVASLFEPRTGYLGIGFLGGDVRILNAKNGEVVLERSDPSVRTITGGLMWAGTLVLRGTSLRGARQATELAAFDIATGEQIWRKDVAALGSPDGRVEVISGVIPAIVDQGRIEQAIISGGGKQTAPRNPIYATLIDVRTGRDAGTPTEVSAAGQGASLNGDMVLWPGILAVGSSKGLQALHVELTALPERGF